MLGRDSFGSTHPAVIAHDRDAPPLEGASEVIDRRGSGAVDDSGAEQGPGASAGSSDLLGTAHDFYRQARVRAVGRSHEHQRIAQAQSFGNILAHARCRGSCKGEYRWLAQPLAGGAELQVGRSEVMARSEMQWASSTQRSAGRARSNRDAVARDSSVSGAVKTTRRPPLSSFSSAARRSPVRSRLWSTTTGTSRFLSARSWSAMRARRGETTIVGCRSRSMPKVRRATCRQAPTKFMPRPFAANIGSARAKVRAPALLTAQSTTSMLSSETRAALLPVTGPRHLPTFPRPWFWKVQPRSSQT